MAGRRVGGQGLEGEIIKEGEVIFKVDLSILEGVLTGRMRER